MGHGYTQIVNKMLLSHRQFQIESEPYSYIHREIHGEKIQPSI